ncbi:hypothetical protein [Streptomyces sp. NPDC051776]|uniref:hypothetical protein n=1 Tax=Streptomyces sp. NPDC051776 TaxID=3155414 RepID=UPI0034204794
MEPVHRPIAGLLADLGQAVDARVMGDPVRGGELGRRRQRPVGDQGEQHPLGGRHVPATAMLGLSDPAHDLVDLQLVPQVVEDVGAAERHRGDELQVRRCGRGQRVTRLQQLR